MLKRLYNYYFGEPDRDDNRPVFVRGPLVHRLVTGYVILAVGIVLGLYLQQRQADKIERFSVESHRALCIQKHNAERTLVETKAYVESDTDGFVFGIPTSVLRRSIKVNQTLLDSLSDVECRPSS